MTPEDFIDQVLSKLNIKKIVIGDDFRFGANREGDFTFLKEWGEKIGLLWKKLKPFLMKVRE